MDHAREDVADFSYDSTSLGGQEAGRDSAGLPARVTVFSDNPRARDQILRDLEGAGFHSIKGGAIADVLDGPVAGLGDVVMIDCAGSLEGGLDARNLAALARLDMRIARSGAQLIVSTSMDALDDVFGALDQSRAQILVQPTRGERIVAVGRVMANVANARLREMTEEDRLSLLHLSQQVEAIAHKLEGLSGSRHPAASHAATATPVSELPSLSTGSARSAFFSSGRHGLPDSRLVRQIIAGRQARARFFDAQLFADPAWDMLLDLTAAHAENTRVSVTSLCIASGVPATTALRWLNQMVDSGVFMRVADKADRRRAFIELSEDSLDAMSRYFELVDIPLARAA
ncbi:MAG: MarR family transcriptional regulator [Pseudomonadota bacterium]